MFERRQEARQGYKKKQRANKSCLQLFYLRLRTYNLGLSSGAVAKW